MPAIDFILIDPEVQSRTPCFAGTRVSVRSLFDAVKRSRSIDYFLLQFPAVARQQVDAVLDRASESRRQRAHGVKLLLDENLPHDLRHHLTGHEAITFTCSGWSGLMNPRKQTGPHH